MTDKKCGECGHCKPIDNEDEKSIDKGLYECIAKRRGDTRKHLKNKYGVISHYVLADNTACDDLKLKKK